MYLDLRDCPANQNFAEHIAKKLGIYVKVANYTYYKGHRVFRLLVDPEIYKEQMRIILFLSLKDDHKSYQFGWLESVPGPVVDNGPQMSEQTTYLRITFM